ncbi:TonB-dependent receptor plug domain-containing protein [Pelagicoccus sp. SDUM812005]|uniref:TonB-dependent receptor plug domain-containing protein n=1 Tax=Pelagicoccus sp. SDUM812005 TaxID=3041257 RepID=UPI00280FC9DE|nr:TonB-dependent receptor plug domain-containing protein [Pelagicoccus sp. SDUM812005]MDQ8183498.1 TonB-dependent receptor plug domain-containing protein [Pelagicoccus sp. SDUM812005]
MKYPSFTMRRLAAIAGVPLVPFMQFAQENEEASEEEIYELSPFTVDGSEDQGYYSSQTMAGGRLATELSDVATSVQVITEEFIQDIGAISMDEILQYTTGTEAVGSMSDYLAYDQTTTGGDIDTSEARQNPQSAVRIRGFAAPTRTTNYFESAGGFSSYVSNRVDINRGANSFLFGLGSPGGIINSSLQQANLKKESINLNHRFSTEDFEDNFSQSYSANMNKILIEDKLAVRFALQETESEYMQKPAWSDSSRRYVAVKFKPFKERNININGHYEIGHDSGVPVDRLVPLETLSTFLDDPYGTVWGSSLDGEITNAAGRRISDPFNSIYHGEAGVDDGFLTYRGKDAEGNYVSSELYGGQMILTKDSYVSLYDGSSGRTDGLADRAVFAGTLNRIPQAVTEFNPNGVALESGERILAANSGLGSLNATEFPEYVGFANVGLLDYDVFDFRRNLISGSIDNRSSDFARKMFFVDAATKDGNFGVEIGYHREHSSQESFVAVKSATIDIDMNYTNPIGPIDPETGYGVPNPNFGRLYFSTPRTALRTDNFDEREAMRATAFAKFDFQEKFDGFLSHFGRHTASVLVDQSTVRTERFTQAPTASGADSFFHLGEDATSPQRGWAGVFYISDPYLEAFENPNFQLSDFYTTGVAKDTVLKFDGDADVPLLYLSRGDPATEAGPGTVANDETAAMGSFTPGFLDRGGVLTQTDVSSQALNLQSHFLRGHLVANVGYREDKVEQIRNGTPLRYGIPDENGELPEGRVEGPAELNNVPLLDSENFTLENGELEVSPKTDTFGYGLVFKTPQRVLPDWLSLNAHYGESSNFSPNPGSFDFWGNTVPGASGETKEYGITIGLFKNKLSARINRYESALINGQFNRVTEASGQLIRQQARWVGSSYTYLMQYDKNLDGVFDDPSDDQITAWIDESGSFQSSAGPDGILDFRQNQRFMETLGREYPTLGEVGDMWKAIEGFWSDFAKETDAWDYGPGDENTDPYFIHTPNLTDIMSDTSDMRSEGTELTLTWNPSRQLRISMSGSVSDVAQDNIAPRFERMLEEWVEALSAVPNGPRFAGNHLNNALANHLRDPYLATNIIMKPIQSGQAQSLFKAQALEGSTSPEHARYSFRALGNYTFKDGAMKGLKVGGSYRWTDARAIGYAYTTKIFLPETQAIEIPVVDVNKPYYGEPSTQVDIWFGYSRKVFNDKAKWSTQLNIRDLFADDEPLVVQVQPDGSPARIAFPAPRQIVWSNSLSF